MRLKEKLKATVLVYTMVLVVIGVFMATVVLNIAVQLSVEYDIRNLEVSLTSIIKTKGELSMKYARDLNSSGDGFVDVLSCPQGITMSGSTLRTTGINTTLRLIDDSVVCKSEGGHNGQDIDIFFNSNYDDLEFAQFDGSQVPINASSLSGVFSDSDTTEITLANNNYFAPDGIDDNFDSDDFSAQSQVGVPYPDGYFDNDTDSKLMQYGYVLEGSGLYNAFWSNTKIKQYIQGNPNNINATHHTLGSVGSGYMSVDINGDHAMFLYRIDNDTYNDTNEIVVEEILSGTGQTGGVGYIQQDLSIANSTANAYDFDFINNDYALFIENTGSGALLYQLRAESALTGSGIYINPIGDSDASIFSYLGSHVLVDEDGQLIGDMFETFGLKSTDSTVPSGSVFWFDASDESSIVDSAGSVLTWKDKSSNGNNIVQNTSGDRPLTGTTQLNGLNTVSFTQDYLELINQKNMRTAFFVIDNANGSNSGTNVTSIFGEDTSSGYSYTFVNVNTSDGNYDISIDGNVSDTGIAYVGGGTGVSGNNINLGRTELQNKGANIWLVVYDESIPVKYIGGLTNGTFYKGNLDIAEIISYDRVLNAKELNKIGNYLSDKWALPWTDL